MKYAMNKIYYLSSCDTCKRIISELELKEKGFVFQDIKTEKITPTQLEEIEMRKKIISPMDNKGKTKKLIDLLN